MPQLPCTPPCTQTIAAWPFGPRCLSGWNRYAGMSMSPTLLR